MLVRADWLKEESVTDAFRTHFGGSDRSLARLRGGSRKATFRLLGPLWVLALAVTAGLKPEHTLVIICYGAVALLAVWTGTLTGQVSHNKIGVSLVTALALWIPLGNTWVGRIWRDLILKVHEHPEFAVLLPEAL